MTEPDASRRLRTELLQTVARLAALAADQERELSLLSHYRATHATEKQRADDFADELKHRDAQFQQARTQISMLEQQALTLQRKIERATKRNARGKRKP